MPIKLYEALGNPDLKKIISDTISASKDLDIDFFGIGALARNIWYIENNLPPRGTKDVDFGVYIPDEETYRKLKQKMVKDFGYTQSNENIFCLISPNQIPVDFLPFGEIEKSGKVLIDGKGLTNINLDGFNEVYQNGIRKANIEDHTINICTVPSVVLLKLIAFDDRPEFRAKDPLDISSIIKNYPHIETELIWDEYNYLYDQDLSHEDIGVIVIGCEIFKLIKDNEGLKSRISIIINNGIDLISSLAERMIIDSSIETIEEKQEQLKLLKRGLENNSR